MRSCQLDAGPANGKRPGAAPLRPSDLLPRKKTKSVQSKITSLFTRDAKSAAPPAPKPLERATLPPPGNPGAPGPAPAGRGPPAQLESTRSSTAKPGATAKPGEPTPEPVLDGEEMSGDLLDDAGDELELYAQYQPLVTGGAPHPTRLCSSSSLMTIERSIVDRLQGHLHERTTANQSLSVAQLEAVAMARRRNVEDRLAFCCGDATGVGKTRIAMGYVANHLAFSGEGREPRVLYVSVASLFDDVVRDSEAIGLDTRSIFNSGRLAGKGERPIEVEESILFVAHSTLARFTAERLLEWLLAGESDAPPVVVVDEVHKCGNPEIKAGKAAAALLNGAHAAGAHILLMSATLAASIDRLEVTAKCTGLVRSQVCTVHSNRANCALLQVL